MPEITRITGADLWSKVPEIVPWNAKLCEAGIDLLICCAGFEDRATAVVDDLEGIEVRARILVVYPTNPSENASAIAKFHGLRGGVQAEILYERADFLSHIRKQLAPWRGREKIRVLVDLSGMASYVIYRVLGAL